MKSATRLHRVDFVEGRVNDLKALKRSMFGRAKPPLLRKRLLLIAASRRPQTVTAR